MGLYLANPGQLEDSLVANFIPAPLWADVQVPTGSLTITEWQLLCREVNSVLLEDRILVVELFIKFVASGWQHTALALISEIGFKNRLVVTCPYTSR